MKKCWFRKKGKVRPHAKPLQLPPSIHLYFVLLAAHPRQLTIQQAIPETAPVCSKWTIACTKSRGRTVWTKLNSHAQVIHGNVQWCFPFLFFLAQLTHAIEEILDYWTSSLITLCVFVFVSAGHFERGPTILPSDNPLILQKDDMLTLTCRYVALHTYLCQCQWMLNATFPHS